MVEVSGLMREVLVNFLTHWLRWAERLNFHVSSSSRNSRTITASAEQAKRAIRKET
jgi:hypothetical protein